MNDYTFGNFLYELRTEKGLSQSQLGELLCVTNKAVSKWENGSAKPNTRLIPRLAEILGVTVEELFACKRLEKDDELAEIKEQLTLQKKKYAILSSVFLSALMILPLLLIEFVCVVMGFRLPDDVAGPLGAVGLIFAFVISLTAFVIYRKDFKHAMTSSELVYPPRFIKNVKNGFLFSAVAWACLLALLLAVYLPLFHFASDPTPANIFLSVAVFILIMLSGAFICFANIKHLLKIKFAPKQRRERIRFSDLPVWCRVCYFISSVSLLAILSIRISGFTRGEYDRSLIDVTLWAICLCAYVPYIAFIIRRAKRK